MNAVTTPTSPLEKVYLPEKLHLVNFKIDNLVSTRTSVVSSKNTFCSLSLKTHSASKKTKYNKYVGIELDGEPALIMLSQWPFPDVLNEITSAEELSQAPEKLVLIAISIIYEKLITELSESLSTNITLTKYYEKKAHIEKNRDYRFRLNFSLLSHSDHSDEGCLLFNRKSLGKVCQLIKKIPSVSYFSSKVISSPIYFEIGTTSLSMRELRSVEQGDIIMIDSESLQDKKQFMLRLTSGHKFSTIRKENFTYNILDEIIMEDENNNSVTTHNENENNISLDDIPLSISFDLGSSSISLDEIKKLGVGYTLELKKEFTDLVTIRINNKAVAKGQLVDIGNRAGVRITSLKACSN